MSNVGLESKARKILQVLRKEYPESECSLIHRNPFELLIATILSAQCTDERVNKVTPSLFKEFPDPQTLATAPLSDVEHAIRSIGLYKSKAKSLKECSKRLVEDFQGRVPDRLEDLIQLRGVGRKTANVILGNAFGKSAVVVDTHVTRISNRLGLTKHRDPLKIEKDLLHYVPKKDWTDVAHLFIDHGRAICKAPRPRCLDCKLKKLCDYFLSLPA